MRLTLFRKPGSVVRIGGRYYVVKASYLESAVRAIRRRIGAGTRELRSR